METSKTQMVSILILAGRTNMFPAQHIILSQGGPQPAVSESPEGPGMRVQLKKRVSKPIQKPKDTKRCGDGA